MNLWKKKLAYAFIFICIIGILAFFLIPIPELTGLVTEKELADADSQFIQVNNINVHYKEMGAGKTTFILLHGFGASVYSWREVMDDFSKHGRVIAYDRPAFGLTERPMPETWQANPYGMGANVELLRGLLDALKIDKAILVGNSAGGGVATAFALEYPQRVDALILVDPGVGGGRGIQFPAQALPLMWTAPLRRVGAWRMRDYQDSLPNTIAREWFDQNKLTDEIKEKSLQLFKIKNWDRALYELNFAPAYPELRPLLSNLKVETFIIAGAEDRLLRPFYFEAIAKEIPAPLVLLSNCGHVPQEECPQAFMAEVEKFLK